MGFQYKYEHLHCGFCAEIEDEGCPHLHCPHILENINDLLCDPEFIEAVRYADECGTYHRSALLMVQAIMDMAEDPEDIQPEPPANPFGVYCTFKAECTGCPYPRHGSICYDKRSGVCLKNHVDAILRKEKPDAFPY